MSWRSLRRGMVGGLVWDFQAASKTGQQQNTLGSLKMGFKDRYVLLRQFPRLLARLPAQIGGDVAVLVADFVFAGAVADVAGLPALFVVLKAQRDKFGFGVFRQPVVGVLELLDLGDDLVAELDVFVSPPLNRHVQIEHADGNQHNHAQQGLNKGFHGFRR